MRKFLVLFAIFILFQNAQSQGKLGLGIFIGSPTGITAKYLLTGKNSVDFLAAWRFNDSFFVHGHYIFNLSTLSQTKDGAFNFLAGLGAFLKASSSKSKKDTFIGVSGNFELNYFLKQKFEFFFDISPKVGLIESTDFDITGGVGFRYYF